MSQGRYQGVRHRGVTFLFKTDPTAPSLLHIYARHLKQPRDAIRVWFGGRHNYNPDHDRFEAAFEDTGIYWFWRNHQRDVVVIISCFDLREP